MESFLKGTFAIKRSAMSKRYPECPLYNHSTCKDQFNPKLCALVREDRVCVKKTLKKKALGK
jgi:hypothetical protein